MNYGFVRHWRQKWGATGSLNDQAGSQNDQAGSQNDQVITLCWTMHCSKTSQPTLGSSNLFVNN
jgi:hypothetical protein